MERIFEGSEYRCERYTCDCFYHVLDVSAENCGDHPEINISNMPLDSSKNYSLRERLTIAWYVIWGKKKKGKCWHSFWDIILQDKDIDSLIELLKWAKTEKIDGIK